MKPRSLVLITVDCLRADHVGFLGYPRPVTPFLDSLAESSLVFSDAIVAGTPTYYSFPGIMASRHPLALGRDVVGIAPLEPTIASVLQEAGYITAAFVASNPYLTAQFGYDQGFDRFQDFLDVTSAGTPESSASATHRSSKLNRRVQAASSRNKVTAAAYDELYFWYGQWRSRHETASLDGLRRYPAADVVVDQACSWLRGLDAPFFLWLHLMDPHHPYYPPQEALASLSSSPVTPGRARFLNSFWNRGNAGVKRLQGYREEILSLYDGGIYWVDKQISRLVQALQQSRKWNETVFAVTADHGEEFLEHAARYHSTSNLSEQLIHVPLLLRLPELAGPRRLPGTFSLIHLAPTLVRGAGVPVPPDFQGRSCWDEICAGNWAGEPAIVECVEACNNPLQVDDRMRPRLLAVRDQNYKLVVNFREGADLLYDLRHDPGERSPLLPGVSPRERARLLQIAHGHLQKLSQAQNADLRLRARLRELRQSERMSSLSN
ncbi:MAG: sulfatase [Terriglobales bacterium]